MRPKITALNEIHRAGEVLVTCTFEVDVTQVPHMLEAFDTDSIPAAQIEALLDAASAIEKSRAVETAAELASAPEGEKTGEEHTPE
jgi:hypothetical protein